MSKDLTAATYQLVEAVKAVLRQHTENSASLAQLEDALRTYEYYLNQEGAGEETVIRQNL